MSSNPGDGAISVEEAVRKAKEIAARLSGQTQVGQPPPLQQPQVLDSSGSNQQEDPLSSSSSGGKRKRWGVMPPAAAADPSSKKAALLLDPQTNGTAAAAIEKVEPITRRVWVSVSEEKPAAHFVAFGNRKIPEILEKVTGEKPEVKDAGTEDSPEDEEDDPNKLTITFQGKGSNPNKPPLPGMPEEPLHARIRGPDKQQVEHAETLMEDCLQEAVQAETDVEAVQAAERALAVTQSLRLDQMMMTAYKPASVAALIHGGGGNNNNTYDLPADKLAAALLHGSTAAVTQEIHVPNGMVGFIIGRGGENIASMQAKTGCKVQIQKEHELQPGQTQRVITLSAATQESVDECRQIIEGMVAERARGTGLGGGGGGGGGGNGSYGPAGQVEVEMDVPDADVGLIIGKMGATIKSIQEESGANIQVPKIGKPNDPTQRTLTISHATEQGANHAKQLIENILRSKPSFASGGPPAAAASSSLPSSTSIQVRIPDKDVGLCIGRQGCVIKHMQNTTRTRIQIPQQPNPGDTHRVATISGPPEGCTVAQQMIERIVAEQSSASVMAGAPFQQPRHPHQQQQQQQSYYGAGPQENQQGYSAEWAAYHAAQQAAAQQQQRQQQQAAAAPAPTAGADAYYEQFFRYAYYYGEDAARAHYGAWSPPPGTPNPYGVNPAGITAVPAATAAATAAAAAAAGGGQAAPAPAAAQAPAAPVAPSAEARETGRRQVSNLPAWMTKK